VKYYSAQPYTEAERERDRDIAQRGQRIGFIRRKALKSGDRRHYEQAGTAESKSLDCRKMGEPAD
jgi:hypothetical protein